MYDGPPSPTAGGPSWADGGPSVLLLLEREGDRRVLEEWLAPNYAVTAADSVTAVDGDFDLYVVDEPTFDRERDAIVARTRETAVFLPLLLLVGRDELGTVDPDELSAVDEVLSVPARRAELRARIRNLLGRRDTSRELAERNAELEATVRELERGKQAMDRAPIGIVITDPAQEDNPIVYANDYFLALTGYQESEVLGRNCRFLQGPATDPETVAEIRRAIDERRPVTVDLVNYTKRGRRFWNKLDVAPVFDDGGDLMHFVGFQTDITERKIREQRLQVKDRVLTHNLRNEMNKVEGYADIALAAADDPAVADALTEMRTATDDLLDLVDSVQAVAHVLDDEDARETTVDVAEVLETAVAEFREAYPGTDLSLSLPDGPCRTAGAGVPLALREVVANAVEHNEGPDRRVDVGVERSADGDRYVVRVADDGPGIPETQLKAVRLGRETPLEHGDGLGLWVATWVVTAVGGDLQIDACDEGTTVTMTLPAATGPDG